MRVLWWIFFIVGMGFEIFWFWWYLAPYRLSSHWGTGDNNFHPWYYAVIGALYILGMLRLYPLARDYDDMGKT